MQKKSSQVSETSTNVRQRLAVCGVEESARSDQASQSLRSSPGAWLVSILLAGQCTLDGGFQRRQRLAWACRGHGLGRHSRVRRNSLDRKQCISRWVWPGDGLPSKGGQQRWTAMLGLTSGCRLPANPCRRKCITVTSADGNLRGRLSFSRTGHFEELGLRELQRTKQP